MWTKLFLVLIMAVVSMGFVTACSCCSSCQPQTQAADHYATDNTQTDRFQTNDNGYWQSPSDPENERFEFTDPLDTKLP